MIGVVIIDDSPTMRALLSAKLSGQPDISVLGTAGDAAEGRELIKRVNPDVITLDIEMPGMDGLEFLEKIMLLRPTPVVVVSGQTQHGNEVTARALALGAIDCYSKTERGGVGLRQNGGRLPDLIRKAAQVRFDDRRAMNRQATPPIAKERPRTDTAVIAIGASTGGVEALQVLLRAWPQDCPPTLIVQHINARFAPAIASTLDNSCAAKVELGRAGQPLRRGHVYLAPGGSKHMVLDHASELVIRLRPGDSGEDHVPGVDALFHSVAKASGNNAIGILLTGMGSDGAKGLLALAAAGARTVAQDETTCTVFGMPRAAIMLGAAQVVAPIDQISMHAFGNAVQ